MSENLPVTRPLPLHRLKIAKKELLTKHAFLLELAIPEPLATEYRFSAGQYLTFQSIINGDPVQKDFSIASAPHEKHLSFGIKLGGADSFSNYIFNHYNTGDEIEVSAPKGRFTLPAKPHEFRTIVGFAGGIGITPILSHFKNILHNEPRSRLFLFYGNKNPEEVAFKAELDELANKYPGRLQIHYFFSRQATAPMFSGRIDRKKIHLIINQILNLDDTDEEATIWDAVDEILICGKGEMIKEIANACYEEGIPKKNIHFELFEEFNEDIYPVEQDFPLVKNIAVSFKINQQHYTTTLPDNRIRILQQLLIQKLPVPYSCKSGICGSCICTLEAGQVELLENEYLTDKEATEGKILACMTIPLSDQLKLNFDPC